eukprot:6179475-Amphidinium_carterae.1
MHLEQSVPQLRRVAMSPKPQSSMVVSGPSKPFGAQVITRCSPSAAIFAKAEAQRATAKKRAVKKRPAAAALVLAEEADSEDNSATTDGDTPDDEVDQHMMREGRQSLAKVFSPVAGYGNDPELAQYVYDLWLWTRLG